MAPKLWSCLALKVYTDPLGSIKSALFCFCARDDASSRHIVGRDDTKAGRILLRSVCANIRAALDDALLIKRPRLIKTRGFMLPKPSVGLGHESPVSFYARPLRSTCGCRAFSSPEICKRNWQLAPRALANTTSNPSFVLENACAHRRSSINGVFSNEIGETIRHSSNFSFLVYRHQM